MNYLCTVLKCDGSVNKSNENTTQKIHKNNVTLEVYIYLFTSIHNNIPQQWVTATYYLVCGDVFRLLMQPSSGQL